METGGPGQFGQAVVSLVEVEQKPEQGAVTLLPPQMVA